MRLGSGQFGFPGRAALLALAGTFALGGAARAQSTAEVMQAVKFEQRLNTQLPLDATFRDEAGRTVALGEYFGKRPVILALVYYGAWSVQILWGA